MENEKNEKDVRNSSNKWIIMALVVVIVVIAICITVLVASGSLFVNKDGNEGNNVNSNSSNNEANVVYSNNQLNSVQGNNENEEEQDISSNEEFEYTLTDEQKILSLCSKGEFDNTNNFSDRDLLEIAEYAINRGYAGGKSQYTVAEINKIINNVVRKNMKGNPSGGLLKYQNGVYTADFADGDAVPFIEIISEDAAAGTIYITYSLKTEDVYGNIEDKGRYVATFSTDTENGGTYVRSIKREQYVEDTPSSEAVSDESRLLVAFYLPDFDDIQSIPQKDLLLALSLGVHHGWFNLEMQDRSYSEEQIKKLFKEVYGIELKENMSVENMKYSNGRYYMEMGDGDPIPSIRNISSDVAAGTTYYTYDIVLEGNAQDEDMGTYVAGINNVKGVFSSKKKK